MGKANVTKEEWLEIGLLRFGEAGLEGLKVERMAEALKSSKAGFYWYFKSRDQYIDSLLDYWYQRTTRLTIDHAAKSADPRRRLERLLLRIADVMQYRDVLFQIRKLSQSHARYATLLERVEAERVGYVARIFRDLGHDATKAEQISAFLYTYYIGFLERNKHRRITKADMQAQYELFLSLFQIDNPSPSPSEE